MLTEIVTTRYDSRTWQKTTLDFVIAYNQLIETYNVQQARPDMVINDAMRRTYMQEALRSEKAFNAVADREQDRMTMGGRPLTYLEYYTLVKSVASQMDAHKKTRNRTLRDTNVHAIKDEEFDDDEHIDTIEANFTKSGDNVAGSRMKLTTWKSLSDETKAIWDTIDPKEKAKILAETRGDAKTPRRSVKLVDQDRPGDMEANVHEIQEEDIVEDEERAVLQANTVLSEARRDAHPGDPRRMMGSDKPSKRLEEKGSASKTQADKGTHLKAMMHSLFDSDEDEGSGAEGIDEYWNSFKRDFH